MSVRDKRTLGKDAKRTAILASATDLFNRNGFRAASMEAIARGAGLAKGTVYLYFPGKEALYDFLLVENLSRALQERRDSANKCADPVDALSEIWQGHVRAFLDDPAFFLPNPMNVAPRVAELEQAHKALIVGIFRRLAQNGRLRLSEPGQAAEFFLAALNGVFLLKDRIEDRGALLVFSSGMFEAVIHGILA